MVAGLYEKVLTLVLNPQKAYNYVEKFSYTQWAKDLQSFLGNGANAMIALEAKEEKYSVKKHKIRFNRIVEKWEQICAIIREEIPTQQEIGRILQTIGLPNSVQEIGIACDLQTTLNATKDIRDKYVLSRLLWDLGELENFI